MKELPDYRVKLLKTIRNIGGDVFRENSIVKAERTYGGFTLTKNRRRNGLVVSVTRVQRNDFSVIKMKEKL